jgi:GTP-binding protein required for 40S ribosome biogenesis
MSDPVGPITVVTSKKQRLTFIECPNELEAMIDMAKVADIVLLMIDGNYGFEMETMEFLNILANTGMPGNVFGILTHLDLFKKPSALKDAKKRLKHRLWTELYQGAHLFYLSGVLNGRYPDREIHNLSRFLSVMKNPRPLVWRNTHPYTIIDNYRDITHPTKIEEDPLCDRTIELSGYLRGTNFAAQGQRVHIAGVGDFTISKIEELPDPCPTPAMEKAMANLTGKKPRRRLDEKDKKLWAPMADRSGMKISGDHIVITREKGFTFDKDANVERGEGEQLIVDLQGEKKLLGQTDKGVKLFAGGEQLTQIPEEDTNDTGRKTHRKARFLEDDRQNDENGVPEDEGFVSGEESKGSDGSDIEEEFDEKRLGKMFRGDDEETQDENVVFADTDSELGSISGDEGVDSEESGSDEEFDSEEEEAVRWKENMMERARALHGKRKPWRAIDLARLMYDTTLTPAQALRRWRGEDNEEEEEEEDIEKDEDTFFHKAKDEDDLEEDRMIPHFDYEELKTKWSNPENIDALRRTRFATGRPKGDGEGDSEGEGDGDDDDDFNGFDEDDEDEGDGAFEDLETGEKHGPSKEKKEEEEKPAMSLEEERERNARRKEELRARFEEEDREGLLNDKAIARREGGLDEEFGEDQWYEMQKAMLQKQLDINKAEYAELDEHQRRQVEGYRAGKYARLVIEGVPAEFCKNFQPRMPILVGGLSATEDRFGFVQVRIKRHRWHKKIRKSYLVARLMSAGC